MISGGERDGDVVHSGGARDVGGGVDGCGQYRFDRQRSRCRGSSGNYRCGGGRR